MKPMTMTLTLNCPGMPADKALALMEWLAAAAASKCDAKLTVNRRLFGRDFTVTKLAPVSKVTPLRPWLDCADYNPGPQAA